MSTRKSTPKRKRQESASRIIDDVSKRLKAEENRLSPESEQIGLRQAADRKKELTNTKSRASELEEQLLEAREANNRALYRTESGDILSLLISGLTCIEKDVRRNDAQYFDPIAQHYGATGAAKITKLIQGELGWLLMEIPTGHRILRLEAEWDLVDLWKENGRPSGQEPKTPLLDRLAILCRARHMDRTTAMRWFRAYEVRNQAAHHPPPVVSNFLKPGGWNHSNTEWQCVEWANLRDAINERIGRANTRFEQGVYTVVERNFLVAAFTRQWFEISEADDPATSEPILTHRAKFDISPRAKSRYLSDKKKRDGPEPGFPSPYVQGKWDDLGSRSDY
ncbi:unnamed protein product [Clonostachys rosea f. rosea IK726]|uniref:Uncharacterized protein n=1 Tax=Clonostachys rosea f. rosea IK726 TaxID=1349383 RepID=A0ACA9U5R4_BIOOC|nr:unnamed protein product [Clonostachys rosea f. rosea IK726]